MPAGISTHVLLGVLLNGALFAANVQRNGTYIATAYSQQGKTASGEYVHRHVVAADPDLLPIGTRIKIRHAGRYSGEYVVADTGTKIVGRKLDIYLPSAAACKRFGRKGVKVQVLQLGDGTREATQAADQAVKHDIEQDVAKKAVGNAATEDDWAAKAAAQKNTAGPNKTGAPPRTTLSGTNQNPR